MALFRRIPYPCSAQLRAIPPAGPHGGGSGRRATPTSLIRALPSSNWKRSGGERIHRLQEWHTIRQISPRQANPGHFSPADSDFPRQSPRSARSKRSSGGIRVGHKDSAGQRTLPTPTHAHRRPDTPERPLRSVQLPWVSSGRPGILIVSLTSLPTHKPTWPCPSFGRFSHALRAKPRPLCPSSQ